MRETRPSGRLSLFFLLIITLVFLTGPSLALAEELLSQVMGLEGSVSLYNREVSAKPLAQGAFLREGDVLSVDKASYADLTFQQGWKNIVETGWTMTARLREDSQVKIQSVYPTGLLMGQGDIISWLEDLPQDSTFEVQTPTAVVGAEGGVFRVSYRKGVTEVWNFSDQDVYVFMLDENREIGPSVILKAFEKTEVLHLEHPKTPQRMSDQEIEESEELRRGMRKLERKIGSPV